MEEGRSRRAQARSQPQPEGFGMFALRLWMWAVPVVMFATAVVFGVIAAADNDWGLLAVMLVIGVTAVALFLFHWWVLYRFGQAPRSER